MARYNSRRNIGFPAECMQSRHLDLDRRNLPTTQNPDSRLSLLDLAGLGGLPDQSDRRAHSQRLAGTKVKIHRNLAPKSAVDCSGRTRSIMVFSLLRRLAGLEKPAQDNAEYINPTISIWPS